jgi:hypothetical protein
MASEQGEFNYQEMKERYKISSGIHDKLYGKDILNSVESLNGTEGRSDNRKCRVIRKTNEKEEGKYQLSL